MRSFSQRRPTIRSGQIHRTRGYLLRCAVAAGIIAIATPLLAQPTVVLIGAKKQRYPVGEHNYPDGILTLERLIKASPAFAEAAVRVKSFPVGFPKNVSEIDDANVIVLYNGWVDGPNGPMNPLQEPLVRQEVTKLMALGVGLIALHQALALPNASTDLPLIKWLGVARVVDDRSTEIVPVTVAASSHPIARGVQPFNYHDELYPAMITGPSVTPILTAKLHTQLHGPEGVFKDPAKKVPIAWAYERPDGGRAFGFSGMHYVLALDDPQVRKLLLNAILWSAHVDVPSGGATANVAVLGNDGQILPDPQTQRDLLPIDDVKKEVQPWGELEWFASRALGNSAHVTMGQATILPGRSNPPHWHPNCDEVLHVISGRIVNRMGGKEFEMKAGDTVVIPEGMVHNARNTGNENAVLVISYNSADRVAIGE